MTVQHRETATSGAVVDGQENGSCLVSFVVVAKNEEDVLGPCIEAIARSAQSLESWECIVVDSASNDRTVAVAMEYPVSVLRLEPDTLLSPAAGRSVGLLHTKGKYVMFVDADCELHSEFVAKAVALMDSEDRIGAVIGTRGYRYGRGLRPSSETSALPIEWWESRDEDVATTGGVSLVRRATLEQTGGHNPFMRSEEERELCLRVRAAGYRIRQMPIPMMIHNSAPGQRKYAYRELWRRFRCGFLEGRGQLLRLAIARRTFSPDYVLDGTRRVVFFLVWCFAGLCCASFSAVFQTASPAVGWLACSVAFFAILWIRVRSLSQASFFAAGSCLEGLGLVAGFAKGCRNSDEFAIRYEILKQTGPLSRDARVSVPSLKSSNSESSRPADVCGEAARPAEDNSERIRVLLACPFPADVVAGGMEKQVGLFLKSEAARRLTITTFDTSHGQRPQHSTLGRILYAPIFVLYYLSCLLKSRAAVVQIRTTGWIVFWKSAVCALVSKFCGCSVILSIHCPDFDEFVNAYGTIGRLGVRWSLERCDRVIALSEVWREYISKLAPKARIAVLPNGVEEDYFEAAETDRPRAPEGKVRLFYIGGGSWPRTIEKGFLDILAALRLNGLADECVLTAAGVVDPDAQRSSADLSLECPGIVDTKEKVNIFRQTDIFVQPSHFENMPNVILEAMASGVPIVATSVGAIPEMIDEPKGGMLVAPEDVESLSAAIKRLVEDYELRRQMGESNYRRARQSYRLTSTTERWVNLIYEVAVSKARR